MKNNGARKRNQVPEGYLIIGVGPHKKRHAAVAITQDFNIRDLLDGLFPEFTQVFKDPCGVTALSVLSACPIPGVIAGIMDDEFVAIVKSKHQGRLMRKKLRELHDKAKKSIGISAGARSLSAEISFLIEKYELIRRHIRIIERTLVSLVDEADEGKYLLSIRGLNYIAAAGLLAELGSFKLYRTAKQMIKMAGSNPTESESAGKRGPHTHTPDAFEFKG